MIVACAPHPEKKSTLIVAVDEEPLIEVSTTIFGRKPSLPSEVDSLETLKELIHAQELKGAKRYVLNKLSQRSYHSVEVANLLKKKLVSDRAIDRVIGDCARYGYIHDKEWLDQYVRRERDKKRGPRWVENKLKQKGIPLEEIQAAIEESDDEEVMRDQIYRLIQTRYRTRNLLDFREREKTIGALVRRGYDINLVRDVIRICSQMR